MGDTKQKREKNKLAKKHRALAAVASKTLHQIAAAAAAQHLSRCKAASTAAGPDESGATVTVVPVTEPKDARTAVRLFSLLSEPAAGGDGSARRARWLDLLVLNAGEQSGVDPNCLRDEVLVPRLERSDVSAQTAQLESMTTCPDWTFARITLRIDEDQVAADDGEMLATVDRVVSALMSATARSSPQVVVEGCNAAVAVSARAAEAVASSDAAQPPLPSQLLLGVVPRLHDCPAVAAALFQPFECTFMAPPPSSSPSSNGSCPSTASTWVHIPRVPGLAIRLEYVDEAQEASLLSLLGIDAPRCEVESPNAPPGAWELLGNGRKVLHYGRRFVYGLNTWAPDAPPLPAALDAALAALRVNVAASVAQSLAGDGADTFFSRAGGESSSSSSSPSRLVPVDPTAMDQCTANWYPTPGVGIPAHTDDTRHFAGPVAVLSLGNDIVMRWIPPPAAAATAAPSPSSPPPVDVLLPRRSLIRFCAEARYDWQHSIVEKRRDIMMLRPDGMAGVTQPRRGRASITFRTTTMAAAQSDVEQQQHAR